MMRHCESPNTCDWPHCNCIEDLSSPEVDAVLTTDDGARIIVHGTTMVALAEKARSLETRLSAALAGLTEADAAAQRWYSAANPYSTPEALKEALAGREQSARILALRAALGAIANGM